MCIKRERKLYNVNGSFYTVHTACTEIKAVLINIDTIYAFENH